MTYKKLTKQEENIIIHKGTEAPFSGIYYDFKQDGNYHCKQCDALLFNSSHKFDSGCGWPSFDDEIAGSVKKIKDADGRRTEIICANCDGHLGHIFAGEGFTPKNLRYCVNSLSLDFKGFEADEEIAYFGGGCFWGVEYFFSKANGVISAVSGFMGGSLDNPSYEEVCKGNSGHIEVVKVAFDSSKTNYENLCKLFFEIHDPTQENGQGNDIGSQYLSVIFAIKQQKIIAQKLIEELENKGLKVATKILSNEENKFFAADIYHQNYYAKNGGKPYCHFYTKRF